VTLKSPKGDELSYVLQIHFSTTNNIMEYEALLHGLHVAKEIGVQHIMCCGDSDLVAQQVAAGIKLMAPEVSLCVVNDQPVGNPKRKV
jgi:ribonuclease HI